MRWEAGWQVMQWLCGVVSCCGEVLESLLLHAHSLRLKLLLRRRSGICEMLVSGL